MSFSESEREMWLEWMLGDDVAVDFLTTVGAISQIGDDIADGDKEGSSAMSDLLLYALDALPKNPFYRLHVDYFRPVFVASILMWDASNDFAKDERREVRMFGYVLREAMDQIIVVAALLKGGIPHARKVAREVVTFYHGDHSESFEEWEKEHG